MLKILIVEDDTEKLRNILKVIDEKCNIPAVNVDHAIDSTSIRTKLKDTHYDLLIVDIAIPDTKSDFVDPEGGIKLIKEILERDHFKTPSHIVGLTALDDAFKKAVEDFSSSTISVIRYSDTDSEWEETLISGISQWQKAKLSFSSIEINYQYDIAIITAVETEFNAVLDLSEHWTRVQFSGDSAIFLETIFNENGKTFRIVAACMSQMGMIASSVLCMKLIYNFRPKYVFMPGIAASLKKRSEHGYGDVFVIDESWDGGAGKVGKDENGEYKFEKNASHLRLDSDLSEKIRMLKNNKDLLRSIKDNFKSSAIPNTELKIHIGSVVSVAGVVANENISLELKTQDRKLLGLEMEVYGVYYASKNCSNPKPMAMALKSICDFADSEKSDDYQSYAAYTSAQVMYNYIITECLPLNH